MCAVESRSAKTVETLLHNGAQTSLKEPVSNLMMANNYGSNLL